MHATNVWRRGSQSRSLLAFRIGLAIGALCGGASAGTVTNLNDSGPGSLRQVIASAVPGETISFAVTGTISLISGELVIDKQLVVSGPGSSLLAISGSQSSRVLTVQAGHMVDIFGLTFRDGVLFSASGGGILNHGDLGLFNCVVTQNDVHALGSLGGGGISNTGTLAATNCVISNNLAHVVQQGGGGIHNTGSMTLNGCSVTGNDVQSTAGGGIYNAAGGVLTMTQSSVVGNTAPGGGGIQNQGDFAATGSTVSLNVCTSYGGGMDNEGVAAYTGCSILSNQAVYWGGGIQSWGGGLVTLTMTNCTISGNMAMLGGGLSNFDLATLSNCTITANEFGVENLGNLRLKNSIVAGNLYGDCLEPANSTSGVNYDSDDTCGAGFTTVTPLQLQLAALANNGGPTWTHGLNRGSVAIDHATDCSDYFGNPVLTDQRGVARPLGPACDVGAYELITD